MKNIVTLLALILTLQAHAIDLNDFSLYGKVALVSTLNFKKGSQSLGDNSSRLGINYVRKDILENMKVGLRGEWSISTNRNNSGFASSNFDGKQFDVVSNDGPFGNRLGYLWAGNENFTISAGKMWSIFYDIPSYTDIFLTDGARASSTYTRTGEVDGTYRASEVVQLRYIHGNFHFGFQTKLTGKETVLYDFDGDGTSESSLVYKQVQAASIQYITKSLTLGMSSINLMFDNNGNNESQLSLTYGLKANYKNFFFNAVYSRAKDLELDQISNKFVHSDGVEAIIGHHIQSNKTLMLGWNHQTRSESGDFQLDYYYLSYLVKLKSLELGAEYIHGDSTNSDSSEKRVDNLKLSATLKF